MGRAQLQFQGFPVGPEVSYVIHPSHGGFQGRVAKGVETHKLRPRIRGSEDQRIRGSEEKRIRGKDAVTTFPSDPLIL
jgi:hypothetical protein